MQDQRRVKKTKKIKLAPTSQAMEANRTCGLSHQKALPRSPRSQESACQPRALSLTATTAPVPHPSLTRGPREHFNISHFFYLGFHCDRWRRKMRRNHLAVSWAFRCQTFRDFAANRCPRRVTEEHELANSSIRHMPRKMRRESRQRVGMLYWGWSIRLKSRQYF